jgi:hypothetical protein
VRPVDTFSIISIIIRSQNGSGDNLVKQDYPAATSNIPQLASSITLDTACVALEVLAAGSNHHLDNYGPSILLKAD